MEPEQPISVSLTLFNECSPESLTELVIHDKLLQCDALISRVRQGLQEIGGSPCQGPNAEGGCPLISCNVPHSVLVDS